MCNMSLATNEGFLFPMLRDKLTEKLHRVKLALDKKSLVRNKVSLFDSCIYTGKFKMSLKVSTVLRVVSSLNFCVDKYKSLRLCWKSVLTKRINTVVNQKNLIFNVVTKN